MCFFNNLRSEATIARTVTSISSFARVIRGEFREFEQRANGSPQRSRRGVVNFYTLCKPFVTFVTHEHA